MAAEIDGTSKGLLGAFAACTLISGIVSLAYGIILLIQNIGVEYNYGVINLFTTSIILIVVGGLLIITVLLGVFGALKDISNLRLVSLVLLFILFVVLVVLGVWAMVSYKTGRLQNSIDLDMNQFKETSEGLTPMLKKKADFLNEKYNCCIAYNPNTDSGEPVRTYCIQSGNDDNTNNKIDFINVCVKSYFQIKSKEVFRVAVLALATAGAVLIALLLYGVVSQRARAGYAAVSRG